MLSCRTKQRGPLHSPWLWLVCLACSAGLTTASAAEPAPPRFEHDIVPILKAYCWKCHGGEGRVAALDLRTLPLLLKGGEHGPAIQPGRSSESQLFQQLSAGKMPPEGALKPTQQHVELIQRWIDSGAHADYDQVEPAGSGVVLDSDRELWAFRTPVKGTLPSVTHTSRVQIPLIDAYLLSKLEAAGLEFSPPADRRTLIRRLYFDLIGLPPTPEEVARFVKDARPDQQALADLVEHLLASPHYGERWGRHWLDAAGYVDVIGSDNDAGIIEEREKIWQYRDWVVQALNEDKPYDRFLLEQLAGDELVDWRHAEHFTPETKDLLIATGFLRQAADVTYAPELNTADIRHQVLYSTVQIVSTNLLGLTLHCAQCHDHKFDPLGQADYYRVLGLLAPAYNVQRWTQSKERFLPDVSAADKQAIDQHNADVDRQVAETNKLIADIQQPFVNQAQRQKLQAIPEVLREDLLAAVGTPADKRNEVQKYLADKLGPAIAVQQSDLEPLFDEATRQTLGQQRQRLAELPGTKKFYGKIQALWEAGPAPPTYIYRRGDFALPGGEVRPGPVELLSAKDAPLTFAPAAAEASSSGYRTQFAQWLTRPDHPLTARVFVNRVWQQYFGRGIVATPDNFGSSGIGPTHPELLDALAVEFIEQGWSLKWLHRQIVLSAAYQQQSWREPVTDSAAADPRQIDPDNKLLWHMPLRRLESEIVRDSLLAVSGVLDRTPGGPPVPLKANANGSVEIDKSKCPTPTSHRRRSLYILARRNYQLSELSAFDQPVVAHNCTRRTSSAVVQQSLTLLNSSLIQELAEEFAGKIRSQAGEERSARIELLFQLALSRAPSTEEQGLCATHLERLSHRYHNESQLPVPEAEQRALVDLCQMILNTNEFLYVE